MNKKKYISSAKKAANIQINELKKINKIFGILIKISVTFTIFGIIFISFFS